MVDVTLKIGSGELEDDEKMSATSILKDNVETKIEKNDRSRSSYFWDDSVHDYPIKYRDNRIHWETNLWQNKTHHKNDCKHK